MNESRGSSITAKRKTGLHITGDRINPHHSHRLHNPYFGRGRDHGYSFGSAHLQKPRGRGFNGHPNSRATSAKGNLNSNASQPQRGVLSTSISSKQTPSKQILNSTTSVSKNGPGNDKPATFVCEGIEVNFDSSDSEEEVRPWRVVKVLKKNDGKNEDALQVNSVDEDGGRQDIIPRTQGKVLHKHDMPNEDQNGLEVQASGLSANSVIIPPTSGRPSFVVLSGLRKRTQNMSGPMSNCAIIKRPRFLFSQQVRPSMRHPHQRFPCPRFEENASISVDKNKVSASQKDRIIEDVLDMMEEVETRAKYLNYRYS